MHHSEQLSHSVQMSFLHPLAMSLHSDPSVAEVYCCSLNSHINNMMKKKRLFTNDQIQQLSDKHKTFSALSFIWLLSVTLLTA